MNFVAALAGASCSNAVLNSVLLVFIYGFYILLDAGLPEMPGGVAELRAAPGRADA